MQTVRVEVTSSAPVEVAVSVEGIQFTARTPVVRDVTVHRKFPVLHSLTVLG
jgi:hypothetical protein